MQAFGGKDAGFHPEHSLAVACSAGCSLGDFSQTDGKRSAGTQGQHRATQGVTAQYSVRPAQICPSRHDRTTTMTGSALHLKGCKAAPLNHRPPVGNRNAAFLTPSLCDGDMSCRWLWMRSETNLSQFDSGVSCILLAGPLSSDAFPPSALPPAPSSGFDAGRLPCWTCRYLLPWRHLCVISNAFSSFSRIVRRTLGGSGGSKILVERGIW